MHQPDLSIIIPAYRSKQILQEQIPLLLGWITQWPYNTEIIIVVDGDDVNEYAHALQHLPVCVTGYSTNRGKGYAIKFGFENAKGNIVLYTDADVPFTPETMLLVADTLKASQPKEMWVIGDRTLPASKYYSHIPRVRKLGSDFFLFVIKHTLGKNYADTQCGLKGFTRKAGELVFNKSHVNRFAFDFECLYIARHLNLPIEKVPVELRNQSPSTVRIYRDGLKLLKDIFYILARYKYD
jgi:dolichyl-phosphate beta-glucosyltransferase